MLHFIYDIFCNHFKISSMAFFRQTTNSLSRPIFSKAITICSADRLDIKRRETKLPVVCQLVASAFFSSLARNDEAYLTCLFLFHHFIMYFNVARFFISASGRAERFADSHRRPQHARIYLYIRINVYICIFILIHVHT